MAAISPGSFVDGVGYDGAKDPGGRDHGERRCRADAMLCKRRELDDGARDVCCLRCCAPHERKT